MCNDPTHADLLQRRHIPPARAFYLDADTRLSFTAVAHFNVGDLLFSGLLLNPQGEIVPFTVLLTCENELVGTSTTFNPGEGWLLSLTVVPLGVPQPRGTVYVTAYTQRSSGVDLCYPAYLLSGYVGTASAPSFPPGLVEPQVSGQGMLTVYTGSDPVAGTDITVTVPDHVRWRLVSFRAQLVTGAAAATRRVHLRISDGVSLVLDLAAADTQIISLARNYNASVDGFARGAADSEIYIPLPAGIVMTAGWQLKTVTTALNALDAWGTPRLCVEQWIEN